MKPSAAASQPNRGPSHGVACESHRPTASVAESDLADEALLERQPRVARLLGRNRAPSAPADNSIAGVDIATAGNSGTKFLTIESETSIRVIGELHAIGEDVQIKFGIISRCEGDLRLEVGDHGVTLIQESTFGGERFLGQIERPWAIDAESGAPLRTWYTVSGTDLIQHLDTRSGSGRVIFDPSYSALACSLPRVDRNAYDYLNMSRNDLPAFCPNLTMFYVSRHYIPVFAYETNVANDAGLVAVAGPSSDSDTCSFSPDTGVSFDFQLPCRAHDYCYDLIRAGFGAAVSKADCDTQFRVLMFDHCNDRSLFLSQSCYETATGYYLAVVALASVGPSPGFLTLRNMNSLKCADVPGNSQSDGAVLTQWNCDYTPNQYFSFQPTQTPGIFRIVAAHSGKCLASAWGVIAQWSCLSGSQFEFSPWSADDANLWTIRPLASSLQECWDVAGSSLSSGSSILSWGCRDQPNQLWQFRL